MTNHTTSPSNTDVQDADLVRRMAQGDDRALAILYDRHARILMSVGMNMLRDAAEVEDLVHDVFLQAWHKASTFDAERGSVRSWLLVRMRSRALDRVRARAVRRDVDPEATPRPADSPVPGTDGALGDAERLHEALHALPTAQQQVMDLLFFQSKSSQQAADLLGIPIGTVKSRVRLAMQSLRLTLSAAEAT